jgi:hypothetical protein
MILGTNQQTVACPLIVAAIKKGSGHQLKPFLTPPPFLFFLLTISVSSLVLIPRLGKASSQPWLPHTRIYFNRPS